MNSENFFQFFGLQLSYNLDEELLTRVYLERQRKAHYDSVTGDSNYSNASINNSDIKLNAAYQTLINPIDRAEHYLKVRGVSILDQLPSDFSEEMFDMRKKYDVLQDESEKEKFCVSLRTRMANIISFLYGLKEDDLEKFRKYTCLLRFINSFLEKVELNAYSRD